MSHPNLFNQNCRFLYMVFPKAYPIAVKLSVKHNLFVLPALFSFCRTRQGDLGHGGEAHGGEKSSRGESFEGETQCETEINDREAC